MSAKHMDFNTSQRLYALLQARLKILPDGLCEYIRNEDTDKTMADMSGLTGFQVSEFRKKNFGKLKNMPTTKERKKKTVVEPCLPEDGLVSEAHLIASILGTQDILKDMQKRLSWLCGQLGYKDSDEAT